MCNEIKTTAVSNPPYELDAATALSLENHARKVKTQIKKFIKRMLREIIFDAECGKQRLGNTIYSVSYSHSEGGETLDNLLLCTMKERLTQDCHL